MTTLLNIQSSPNLSGSASRAASKVFVDSYVAHHAGTHVVDLDLARNPPAHINTDHLGAFFAPPESHSPANAAALKASDQYVAQLLAADVIVIGTPMHNFGIASTLKSWVDNVSRAGKTFKYTETGPVGMLSGKKVVIVLGSGGIYSGGPFAAYDHATTYLQAIFSFFGLTDITVVRSEGLSMGPEAVAKGTAAAAAEAMKAAA